ncbi:hypothetical protein JCM10207_003444 [Rhodosporidiobolus poonsookiae]
MDGQEGYGGYAHAMGAHGAFPGPLFVPSAAVQAPPPPLAQEYTPLLPRPHVEDDPMSESDDSGTPAPTTNKLSNARMPKKPRPRPPAPEGAVVTDKSCTRCRLRKVRCNRVFPRCDHCTQRGEDCDLREWKPRPKIKPHDPTRVAELEKRLAELEKQLEESAAIKNGREEGDVAQNDTAHSFGAAPPRQPPPPHPAFGGDYPLPALTSYSHPLPNPPAYPPRTPPAQGPIYPDQTVSSSNATNPAFPFASIYMPSSSTSSQSQEKSSPESQDSAAIISSIGATSISWRLATPQMMMALSRHLTEAFRESCCFLLPTYDWFRGARMREFLTGDESNLTPAHRVALAAFCAVGARTSPHSAVLGISLQPSDITGQPIAPLSSAGARRENACQALLDRAHETNFKAGTMETASVENLAALLCLLQLSLFVEIIPAKSRPLLRSAFSHYKELQDEASTDEERRDIRQSFGLALYSSDCLISACARRKCLITIPDLREYFEHNDTKIITPRLPTDKLLPIVEKLLHTMPSRDSALKTSGHLLRCWTCACQRLFVEIAAPPQKSLEVITSGLDRLWTAIDDTCAAAHFLLSLAPPQAHDHAHDAAPPSPLEAEHHTIHESDYGAQFLRLERDLMDLVNLIHAFLSELKAPALPAEYMQQSLSRVRRGLRRRAFCLKAYVSGADLHMTFHEFSALEFLPNWTSLAVQRFGTPGGPLSEEEEVSETELRWFKEGLHHACYFHPDAEKRLQELSPRLAAFEDVTLMPAVRRPSGASPDWGNILADSIASPSGTPAGVPTALPPPFSSSFPSAGPSLSGFAGFAPSPPAPSSAYAPFSYSPSATQNFELRYDPLSPLGFSSSGSDGLPLFADDLGYGWATDAATGGGGRGAEAVGAGAGPSREA